MTASNNIPFAAGGTTTFLQVNGYASPNTTEAVNEAPQAVGGTISSFTATFEVDGGTGWSVGFQLRDQPANNGTVANLGTATCSLSSIGTANTTETCTWNGSVTYNAGDSLDMQMTVSGGSPGKHVTFVGWRISHT